MRKEEPVGVARVSYVPAHFLKNIHFFHIHAGVNLLLPRIGTVKKCIETFTINL